LEIALSGGFIAASGGITELSLKIQNFRRNFKSSAGNPPESRKFPAVTRSFRSSAEKRNLQRKNQKFGGSFDFPAECFVFR
jgi:hypothetical protein